MSKIRQWFFDLRWPIRWAVALVTLAVLLAAAVTVSATTWEYTNSPEFCGTTCHTMPPEYAAYQVSPHARVDCVDCHLGQDSFLLTVPRKAREITHVINALTQAYEPPIYVKSLRPARDTCEQCHNPDKFSSDTFVEIKHFDEDVANTLTRIYLIIKTGGGTSREGLGRGIHWHVENEVWYYANDHLKQEIPYIREIYPDGEIVEYIDVEAGLPADFGQQVEDQLQRMDCIDCHTRISHLFRSPDSAMDRALARQQIDAGIPYIKQNGVAALSGEYETVAEGLEAIAGLGDWYQENYPDYYANNEEAVEQAITVIQDMFTDSVFPNMEVGWQTHPDNSGHKEFPGCFRCHDGKHTSPEGQTIRLECNICHSIPEVVQANMAAPVLSIDKPGEPESHKDSNWLARHRYEFDETCAACHDVSNPGGADNTSFCANSACHATEWPYVGLDAPGIRALVEPPRVPGSGQPEPIPHPIGPDTDCTICHDLGAVHPYPEDHTSYGVETCTQCHQPALAGDAPDVGLGETQVGPGDLGAPHVPHTLEGQTQCLTCHGIDAFKPYPEDHVGRTTETCVACHEPATIEEASAEEASPDAETTAEEETDEEAETGEEQPAEETAAESVEPDEETAAAEEIRFAQDIQPLLAARCLDCHNRDTAMGGLNVSSYESVSQVLEPGAPEDSLIVEVMQGRHPYRLVGDNLQLLSDWIAAGAANRAGETEDEETAGAEATTGDESEASGADEAAAETAEETEDEAEDIMADGIQVPSIPHELEGREECLLCHAPDAMSPVPDNHQNWPEDTCQGCHALEGEAPALDSAAIPHELEGRENCLLCHQLDQLPEFHQEADFTTAECLLCHSPQTEEAGAQAEGAEDGGEPTEEEIEPESDERD